MEYQGARSASGGHEADKGSLFVYFGECVSMLPCTAARCDIEREVSLIRSELLQSFILLLLLTAQASCSLPSAIAVPFLFFHHQHSSGKCRSAADCCCCHDRLIGISGLLFLSPHQK